MRTPAIDPPPINLQPGQVITQIRQYSVITPIFGGGVHPGESDPLTVVRGSSIRGQLRFWWRASRGGEAGASVQAMRQAEDEVWGRASTRDGEGPSCVQIAVRVEQAGEPDSPFFVDQNGRTRVGANWDALAYAAFPLQPPADEAYPGMETKAVRRGVVFTLTISFPAACQADVAAALWAWETFGGIGARTRRGFGALRCTHIDGQPVPPLPTSVPQIEHWLHQQLQVHVSAGAWPPDVPHLSHGVRFKVRPPQGQLAAWRGLIESLRSFRQQRNPGTPPKPAGRSRWPEPTAIRHRLHIVHPTHGVPIPNPPVDKFPRAAFGLPIIFHFIGHGEPSDTTLEGAQSHRQRLASPLILRPLACGVNQAVGLALILDAPRVPPGGIVLEGTVVNTQLDPAEAARLTRADGTPLLGMPGMIITDVLEAFLHYL